MLLEMMIGKLHRATLTGCRLDYEGSITVDPDLLAAAGILPFQKVQVYGVESGSRIETYAITGTPRSRHVFINGAAARLFQTGDRVIICGFASMDVDAARSLTPRIVLLGTGNTVLAPAPS